MPTAYTRYSIDEGDPPHPVCDHCIEEHYHPDVFEGLLAKRRRFHED